MHVLTVSHSCLILQQGPTPLLERMRLRNDRYAWTCEAGENRARSGAPLGDRAGGRRQRAHAAWGRRGASGGAAVGGRRVDTETTEVQMQKKTGGS
ncbi:unnamed protein product [Prorocentrum cordatum]|uniref:Uncharacterized protein n=1 Tax=Prorocentrum cordatum TaxID=2364126 RepID=A0ABN9Y4J5_9DINO|nr:unnamed protein product [Polarella glacialis]